MKSDTKKTTDSTTAKSTVYIHELLLFVGAAIMLAVASPRTDLDHTNSVTLNLPSTNTLPAIDGAANMSPVELTESALLSNIEEISVIPAAGNPLPSAAQVEPAS